MLGKDDHDLTRLHQYHLLEKKQQEFELYNSNEEFLFHSKITAQIYNNVLDEFDRLYELMQRTNHLNYTNCDKLKKNLETV